MTTAFSLVLHEPLFVIPKKRPYSLAFHSILVTINAFLFKLPDSRFRSGGHL